MYQLNVTDKIDLARVCLSKWKGKHLTFNGRMMIFKIFALSQLVFSIQSCAIRKKNIERIEQMCYTFVSNSKAEKVSRSILKNTRAEGGINGIDIESFVQSIQVRQYIRAQHNNRPLGAIQNTIKIDEGITVEARKTLKFLFKESFRYLDAALSCHQDFLGALNIRYLGTRGNIADVFLQGTTENLRLYQLCPQRLGNCINSYARRMLPPNAITMWEKGLVRYSSGH